MYSARASISPLAVVFRMKCTHNVLLVRIHEFVPIQRIGVAKYFIRHLNRFIYVLNRLLRTVSDVCNFVDIVLLSEPDEHDEKANTNQTRAILMHLISICNL